MSKPTYYYKSKTSVSLNNLLSTNLYFKENWKLIPMAINQLNFILSWKNRNSGKTSIARKHWEKRFGQNYTKVVYALEELELMTVNRNDARRKYTRNRYDKGQCYSYLLTPLCCDLLGDENKAYLYKSMFDVKEIRKIQKAKSRRGYNRLIYGDVRDEHKSVIDGIEIHWEKIMDATGRMNAEKEAYVYKLLIDIVRKDYGELKNNKSDNRIWNPYTQLPAEIKSIITINGWKYQMTIDIRSCYPSLWAEYICRGSEDVELLKEKAKYNGIFMAESINPKKYFAELLSIDKNDIKDVLIQYFNGKRIGKAMNNPFRKFNEYLSTEYPLMYKKWQATDIKQTGNDIGKYFETRLMLDRSIYRKAAELKIGCGYEYDGFSLYADNDNNCQALLDFIKSKSLELLGVQLVFVDKVNTWNLLEMAEVNNEAIFNDEHKEWVKVCRKTFAKKRNGIKMKWDEFMERRQSYYASVKQYIAGNN